MSRLRLTYTRAFVADLVRQGINTIPDMVDHLCPYGRWIDRQRIYDALYRTIRNNPVTFVKVATKAHPNRRGREVNVYILGEE